MNRKTLVIFFACLFFSIIIFLFTFNNKLDYLALGDELVLGITPFNDFNKSYSDYFSTYLNNKNKLKTYIKKFSKKGYHITDLINDMKNNKELKINKNKVNINQVISNSDIITISIGQSEISDLLKSNYKNSKLKNKNEIYNKIDDLISDYVVLLNKIRKINDSEIYIIGYYNPLKNTNQKTLKELNEIFNYINERFTSLEENKNIYYIKINEGIDNKDYYIPNYKIPYPSLEGYNYISNQIICQYEKKC